jgi:hypothetical protein
MELWSSLLLHHLHQSDDVSFGAMELWSSLLNHHLHERDNTSFADPAGCSSYGALHATCKDEAPRIGAHKQPRLLQIYGAYGAVY